jgi:DNA repair protein RadC
MEDVRRMSERELLAELIGKRNAARLLATPLLPQLQSGHPPKELRRLIVAQEIWQRLCIQDLSQREVFTSPEAVKSYLSTVYASKPYEVFVVLFLDAQNRLIAAEEMFRGTLTQTSVYPREVVVRALEHRAASVILSHNHPSGCPTPSRADEALTHTLKAALALVDVRVLDHLIWGGSAVCSMAETGLV